VSCLSICVATDEALDIKWPVIAMPLGVHSHELGTAEFVAFTPLCQFDPHSLKLLCCRPDTRRIKTARILHFAQVTFSLHCLPGLLRFRWASLHRMQ
jgi:hypothetical protein